MEISSDTHTLKARRTRRNSVHKNFTFCAAFKGEKTVKSKQKLYPFFYGSFSLVLFLFANTNTQILKWKL